MFESIKKLGKIQWFLIICSILALILLAIGWFKQSDTSEKEEIDQGETLLIVGLIFGLIGVFGYLFYTKNKEAKSE
jgi:drug/metabolite transporter (DMT)-like permease